MSSKIKLQLAFMKMYFSSESFHTELTADKVYYTSKMLVQNITNQMSASKMMRKKIAILIKN